MPSPTTIEEFLDLVRKSGVVEDKRLVAYLSQLRATGESPRDPSELASNMIRDGVLTQFQAEQLLQGKWRRFSIGKYRVLERLGTGGMGSVYLCEHTLMRRRVALKVLPTAKADDPAALERFYREARAVAAVDHPNIVRAYDIDQEDKIHFLVMEHVDGSSLQEIIKKTGPMDVVRACHYIRQAAQGLQHAHETAGLVHRDIKPGNLLVDRGGVVKVLDMGLARFFHDKDDGLSQKYDENVLGTADYLAPEQAIDSHTADIRADIYSLGATFYFMLTGQTPFGEGTVAQKLIWHQTRQPRPLQSLRADVPSEVVAIVEKMMAKDPAQRYPTPEHVIEALVPWTQTPIAPPPEEEMPALSPAMANLSDSQAQAVARASSSDTSPRPRSVWQTPAGNGPQSGGRPAPAGAIPPSSRGSGSRPRQSSPAPAPIMAPPAPSPAPVRRREAAPPASTARSQATTTAPAAPSAEEAVAWGSLADTADGVKRQNTPSSARRKAPGSRRRLAGALAERDTRRMWWIIGGAGAGVLVLLLVLLTWAFRQRSSESVDTTGTPVIYVNKAGANGEAKTLDEALKRARKFPSGARILLRNDIFELARISAVSNLTIEPAGDSPVIWKPPAGGLPLSRENGRRSLIGLFGVENVHLRGLIIDGSDANGAVQADVLVQISGTCPGTSLKDITFKAFNFAAVELTNCNGGPAEKRVALNGLTIQTNRPTQAGLYFDHNDKLVPGPNWNIVIRSCTLQGPGTKVKAKNKQACLLANIELPAGWEPKISDGQDKKP